MLRPAGGSWLLAQTVLISLTPVTLQGDFGWEHAPSYPPRSADGSARGRGR